MLSLLVLLIPIALLDLWKIYKALTIQKVGGLWVKGHRNNVCRSGTCKTWYPLKRLNQQRIFETSDDMGQYMTMTQDIRHDEIRRPRCPFGRERWGEKGGRCLDWEAVARPGQKKQGIWKAHGFWRKSPPNQTITEDNIFVHFLRFNLV